MVSRSRLVGPWSQTGKCLVSFRKVTGWSETGSAWSQTGAGLRPAWSQIRLSDRAETGRTHTAAPATLPSCLPYPATLTCFRNFASSGIHDSMAINTLTAIGHIESVSQSVSQLPCQRSHSVSQSVTLPWLTTVFSISVLPAPEASETVVRVRGPRPGWSQTGTGTRPGRSETGHRAETGPESDRVV